jgi:two-component system sensor histidine kinase DegS
LKNNASKIYRVLFENAQDAIIIHDSRGQVIEANKAAFTITGYSKHEIEHLPLSSIFSEESCLMLGVAQQNLVAPESSEDLPEIRLFHKDGTLLIYNVFTNILQRNPDNSVFQITLKDISQQIKLRDSLHLYVQQATRAQEEERKRISLELHDQTIQDMVALSRQLDLLVAKTPEYDQYTSQMIKEVKEQTTKIIHSIRRISQNLRPATLDRLGLLPALGFLISEFTGQTRITAKITTIGDQVRLSEEIELMLFRITQEALNNVLHHAHATQVAIEVEFQANKIIIRISDDGQGFNYQDSWFDIAQKGKLGMVGMQERAHLIGGNLSVKSELGTGTSIIVDAPIA